MGEVDTKGKYLGVLDTCAVQICGCRKGKKDPEKVSSDEEGTISDWADSMKCTIEIEKSRKIGCAQSRRSAPEIKKNKRRGMLLYSLLLL